MYKLIPVILKRKFMKNVLSEKLFTKLTQIFQIVFLSQNFEIKCSVVNFK